MSNVLFQADVIVCATNGRLGMSGLTGRSLVHVAGVQMLNEIRKTYGKGLQYGEVAVVKGYKLQCKEVYLAALPEWKPGSEQVKRHYIS